MKAFAGRSASTECTQILKFLLMALTFKIQSLRAFKFSITGASKKSRSAGSVPEYIPNTNVL
jgi:hypothetical protein